MPESRFQRNIFSKSAVFFKALRKELKSDGVIVRMNRPDEKGSFYAYGCLSILMMIYSFFNLSK